MENVDIEWWMELFNQSESIAARISVLMEMEDRYKEEGERRAK
jgi:hypothetical protein